MSVPELNRMVANLLTSSASQSTKIETIERDINDIKADVREIRTSLAGNGNPGIITRLDRVEQRHKHLARATWILVATFIGAAVQYFCGFKS